MLLNDKLCLPTDLIVTWPELCTQYNTIRVQITPLTGRRCECLLSDPHPAPGQWQCGDHHNVSIVHLKLHNRLGNFKKIFPCPLFKQKVKSSYKWLDLWSFSKNKLEVYFRYLFPTHKSWNTNQWNYCHLIYCKQIPALSQLTSYDNSLILCSRQQGHWCCTN